MTVVVASTDDDAARQPHAATSSASLDRVALYFGDDNDDYPKERRPSEANSGKRKFPSWTKTQIPRWGTRVCVPEWDHDELIDYDDNDDDDNNNSNSNNDGDIDDERGSSCDYGSGRVEDEADEYRIRNGWKVRSFFLFLVTNDHAP